MNNPVYFVDPDGMRVASAGGDKDYLNRNTRDRFGSYIPPIDRGADQLGSAEVMGAAALFNDMGSNGGSGDGDGNGNGRSWFGRLWDRVFGKSSESTVTVEEGTWSFVDTGNVLLELTGESRVFNKVLEVQQETKNSSTMIRWQSMAGAVLMEEKFMNGGLMTSMGIGSHGSTPMLYSVDRLVEIANEGGTSRVLSKAGHALQKHGGRKGTFPPVRGSNSVINKQAESVVRNILENYTEQTIRHHGLHGGILEYRTSFGQGVRFTSDGSSFKGFIEN